MKKDNKNKNASKKNQKNMSVNQVEASEEILIKEKFKDEPENSQSK